MESISENDFEDVVIKSDTPVLVDFWAEWCGPCKALGPKLEALSKEYEGKVKFVKVNVDQNRDSAIKYGVRGIPTIILFKNGDVVDQLVGDHASGTLKEFIDKA